MANFRRKFALKCMLLEHTNITVVVLQPRLKALRRSKVALALLVLWVFTDYSDASLSLNDFAFFANWFN